MKIRWLGRVSHNKIRDEKKNEYPNKALIT